MWWRRRRRRQGALLSEPKGEIVEQAGAYRIRAPRQEVWQALNDPAVLMRCLEGCRSMTPSGENEFKAQLGAKVGPVKANFNADILLSDVVPPESYRLDVRVKGGVAGFANGSATVNLEEAGDARETLLRYRIQGAIGGKLAQIGSRLVATAARKMTERFFERFAVLFAGTEASSTAAVASSADIPNAATAPKPSMATDV